MLPQSESGRALSWGTILTAVSRPREDTPLIGSESSSAVEQSQRQEDERDIWSHRWIPDTIEHDDRPTGVIDQPRRQRHHRRRQQQHHHPAVPSSKHRSVRRRIFLLLTDPTSSYASAIFFVILVIAIAMINIIMFMQTMDRYQFVPDDCFSCGGNKYYVLEDDEFVIYPGVACVCPPAPNPSTVKAADYIVYFFTVEWSLRVLFFEPAPAERSPTCWGFFCQWLGYLTDTSTVLDALAIFPYYAERFEKTNGLMSLRLLRLFRVFQLVRLGQYNASFMSLTNVLYKSVLYLKLLIVVLLFGAAFFGSIVYWLEKGDWTYYEKSGSYEFLRTSIDGLEKEPTPFTSIPVAFWWFLVTATTVGYGDMYPTTVGGRCVAAMAMLVGVLVIAFPVSVFSDLWSHELKQRGVDHEDIFDDDDGIDNESSSSSSLGTREPSMERENGGAGSASSVSFDGGRRLRNGSIRQRPALSPIVSDASDDCVTLDANDVAEITKHLRLMDRSQRKIRGILAKYDIET